MSVNERRPFYAILRTAFFFTAFLFVCFASVLYAAGNARNFTEKTQVFLLNAVTYSGLSVSLCALLDFVFNAALAIKRKKHALTAVFLIFGALSFIFSGAAAMILAFTKGNIQ